MMVNEEKENWYLVSSFWGQWTNSASLGLKQTSILYDMFLKKKKKSEFKVLSCVRPEKLVFKTVSCTDALSFMLWCK